MSSDPFVFDDSFFDDPFSPNSDTPIDLESIIDNLDPADYEVPLQDCDFGPNLFTNSSPNHQFDNLSLTHLGNVPSSGTQFADYSVPEMRTDDTPFPLDLSNGYQSFQTHSYSGAENVGKMMQRSHSSNCFDGKPSSCFQPGFDSLVESPNYQTQFVNSPDQSFSNGQIRRVCSAGNLQMQTSQGSQRMISSSPLAAERSFMVESSYKVAVGAGRYSAEEKKEKIDKYRAKRTLRNYSKTIKYACRKTLADNRPRVRGRFARNDETEENSKTEEDRSWVDGFHEEMQNRRMGRGASYKTFGPSQSQSQSQGQNQNQNLNQMQYYGYS